MSVSSVSSYSNTLWEEYLEQLQKKQRQKGGTTTSKSADTAANTVPSTPPPDEMLSELQNLQNDPERLKTRAAELAVQVTKEAENSTGILKNTLTELASDLEEVAETGDLSVMQEKQSRNAGAAAPNGPPPNGMSGSSGISSKLLATLIEDEDEDEDEDDESSSGIDEVKILLEEIQELPEEEKSKISDAQTPPGLITDQLSAIYAQRPIQASTVSLSG